MYDAAYAVALEPPFRPATEADAAQLAAFYRIASGGVSLCVWRTLRDEYPGLSLLEIGARRYGRLDSPFSFRNSVIVEVDGETAGMLHAYPEDPPSDDAAEAAREAEALPAVLRPYRVLEAPGTWYISAVVLHERYRGRGLGTEMMRLAEQQAAARGHDAISLIVFEQNAGAVRLYERLGYREARRAAIVPDELIDYTGDAILMVKRL